VIDSRVGVSTPADAKSGKDHDADPLEETAAEVFAEQLEADQVPSIRLAWGFPGSWQGSSTVGLWADTHLTYMIDIPLTTEFMLAPGGVR
jgi:hypothetical protein